MKRFLSAFLSAFLNWRFLILVGFGGPQGEFTFAKGPPPENLELGQLLMVGFSETTVTPALLEHLKTIKPGAVILFRRNIQSPQQLLELTSGLQRELKPFLPAPLLFAIDQEGGSVFRIPVEPRVPSAAALGKSKDPQLVETYGFAIGQILRRHGIAMNLAPVLDLDISTHRGFIGSRSFGEDPQQVAQMGFLFSKGLSAAGVIPTGKHFPGLGGIQSDPHLKTPVSPLEWGRDWNRELLPFREFSRLMPSALMLSHVIYPRLDRQQKPASVSPYIINKVLRGGLDYQGLVVTDDILMKGISSQLDSKEAALAALNSGSDLIMISWSKLEQRNVALALQKALSEGRVDPLDIKSKLDRIQKIKNLIGLGSSLSLGSPSWKSPEIQRLNEKLLNKILKEDVSLMKKTISFNKIYFYNLPPPWLEALPSFYPNVQSEAVIPGESFDKLFEKTPKDSLLFFGVNGPRSLEGLNQIPLQWRQRTVVIVTADFEVPKKETFLGVLAPLWPFEGLAEKTYEFLKTLGGSDFIGGGGSQGRSALPVLRDRN